MNWQKILFVSAANRPSIYSKHSNDERNGDAYTDTLLPGQQQYNNNKMYGSEVNRILWFYIIFFSPNLLSTIVFSSLLSL